jgi:hypothetical protein
MCSELGRIASEPKTKWPATLLQQEEVGIGRSPPCVQQGRLLDRVQFRRVGTPEPHGVVANSASRSSEVLRKKFVAPTLCTSL